MGRADPFAVPLYGDQKAKSETIKLLEESCLVSIQTCKQELEGGPTNTPKGVSNLLKMVTKLKLKSEAEKEDILNNVFNIKPYSAEDSNHLMNTEITDDFEIIPSETITGVSKKVIINNPKEF